jgi:hypothetical protein
MMNCRKCRCDPISKAIFLAEGNIKPGPFMVFEMEGLGQVRLVQAMLKTSD